MTFKKPSAPVAPVELRRTGTITYHGTVIVSKHAQLNFEDEVSYDGKKTNFLSGELAIVELNFVFKKYEVQMNGHSILVGNEYAKFQTLAEAATWAGF